MKLSEISLSAQKWRRFFYFDPPIIKMSGPFKSLFQVAATSLLAVAPPPRVSSILRAGRGSGRRILSQNNIGESTASNNVRVV
jgi:hypothetical protein